MNIKEEISEMVFCVFMFIFILNTIYVTTVLLHHFGVEGKDSCKAVSSVADMINIPMRAGCWLFERRW